MKIKRIFSYCDRCFVYKYFRARRQSAGQTDSAAQPPSGIGQYAGRL
jgi:hypothetical protein